MGQIKIVVSMEVVKEEDELIEPEIRDKFKRMCEGYYDNVAKKLVREHDVSFCFQEGSWG